MEIDLKIDIKKNDLFAVLELVGDFDAFAASRFRETIVGVIEEGSKNIIVNMKEVEYIDSAGLGALVGGLKRVSEKDGKIVIVSDNYQVKKVFEITGLVKVFSIFTSEPEAVDAISAT